MIHLLHIVSDEFFEEKTLEIGNNLATENTDYIQLIHKSVELFNSIKEHLPESSRSLISDFENTHLLMQGIALEEAFRHGIHETITQTKKILSLVHI